MIIPIKTALFVLAPLVLALFGCRAVAIDRPCGVDAPCRTASGDYYLSFPSDWRGDELPALLFFHGFRSSGVSVINSRSLREVFNARGYLIIAPNGAPRSGSGVRGWSARPDTGGRDDVAFAAEVVDDVAQRVPLLRDRVLVSGFSAGGSMAWLLGCYAGNDYAAFAPVAGALRRPLPEAGCPGGPVRLLHFHGFADRQVPLEGRRIRDWHQGDVFESLALLRRTNVCRSRPTRFEAGATFRCRFWDGCRSGRDAQFCLHDGGHSLPLGWGLRALDWFENGALKR